MRQLFLVLILFCTTSLVEARNVNPRHKLTITMHNFVLQTQVGQAIHSELMHYFPKFDYRYGCTSGDVENSNCPYRKAFKVGSNSIIIHPDFHASSNEYLSWIMVQAMAKMVYIEKYELKKYSRLNVVEVEQLVFLQAQQYWEELRPPMSRDLDYYNTYSDYSNIGQIARALDLSVLAFSRAFNRSPSHFFFFNKVAARAAKKDGITSSASDIISGNYSDEEKEIAKMIIVDLHHDLERLVK
ncbi:hypothetical protein [Halobacteriovorax sp. HLS]|uniref:hypothetical protein n=1 Tax=Halobacteriovorax sp. HLS TaxID=2234000 RepID=UPI000FD891B0|nr:hypothetical protein [Halobacteriovorax sp. HLS]